MSVLTSLARAHAVLDGKASRIATVRHVHLSDRPLVLIPLTMAGEANAPLAALVGDDRARPTLLVVPQPRNRDLRFAFAADLAGVLLPYLQRFSTTEELVPVDRGRDTRRRFTDAPQVIVPNPGGIGFTRLFGRATRFRRTDGPYPVDARVPELGRWLTFLATRAERPGSSLLIAATDALTLHWASGQSDLEDLNLAAQLAWIDPPVGLTGADAAALAEDPLSHPPAGPATDPTFDNVVLAPLITAYNRSEQGTPAHRHAVSALETALAGQLEPTWNSVWHAIDLLRDLPPGEHVPERWADDRNAFTGHVEHLDSGGPPQPKRDSAVAAAQRLSALERALARFAAQRAFDDPLVMAEYRVTGEAFRGEVVAAEPNRVDTGGPRKRLRPRVTVATGDPVRLEEGAEVIAPTRAKQKATVVRIDDAPQHGYEVIVELSGGMGRALTPAPGTVPEVGEQICYTTLTDTYQPAGSFPPAEETPWTHGGPPTPYVADDDPFTEDWS